MNSTDPHTHTQTHVYKTPTPHQERERERNSIKPGLYIYYVGERGRGFSYAMLLLHGGYIPTILPRGLPCPSCIDSPRVGSLDYTPYIYRVYIYIDRHAISYSYIEGKTLAMVCTCARALFNQEKEKEKERERDTPPESVFVLYDVVLVGRVITALSLTRSSG